EAGVEGFESAGWFGLFVPKDTPDEIVAQISDAVLKALGSEEVREQMAAQSSEPQGMAHGKFALSPSQRKLSGFQCHRQPLQRCMRQWSGFLTRNTEPATAFSLVAHRVAASGTSSVCGHRTAVEGSL